EDRARPRVIEARPAAVRVELRVAVEELRTAAPAPVHTRGLRRDIFAGPRRFGTGTAQHPELIGRQPHPPLVVGAGQLVGGQLGRHVLSHSSTVRRAATGPAALGWHRVALWRRRRRRPRSRWPGTASGSPAPTRCTFRNADTQSGTS